MINLSAMSSIVMDQAHENLASSSVDELCTCRYTAGWRWLMPHWLKVSIRRTQMQHV